MKIGLKRLERGFTLIEVVMAIALVLVLIVGGVGINQIVAGGIETTLSRTKVNRLLREGMETVLSIRADDFTRLNEGVFYPVYDDVLGWDLLIGEEVENDFTRRIRIDRVLRRIGCGEAVCEVVDGGGVVDSNSFRVTIEVEWSEKGETKQEILRGLITYWR